MDVTTHEPMDVKRIQTENGSHIEPALDDNNASDLEMLRWKAGVFKADTGLTINIVDFDNGDYGLSYGTGSWFNGACANDFHSVWVELTQMQRGAEFAQSVAKEKS